MGVDPTPSALPPRELTLQAGSRNCCAWKFDGQASQLGTTSDLMPPIFPQQKNTHSPAIYHMSIPLCIKSSRLLTSFVGYNVWAPGYPPTKEGLQPPNISENAPYKS